MLNSLEFNTIYCKVWRILRDLRISSWCLQLGDDPGGALGICLHGWGTAMKCMKHHETHVARTGCVPSRAFGNSWNCQTKWMQYQGWSFSMLTQTAALNQTTERSPSGMFVPHWQYWHVLQIRPPQHFKPSHLVIPDSKQHHGFSCPSYEAMKGLVMIFPDPAPTPWQELLYFTTPFNDSEILDLPWKLATYRPSNSVLVRHHCR